MGLAAGLASWLLTLALSPLLGVGPPSLAELLLALTLGASLGALLALALDAWWTRRSADRS